MLLKQPYDSKTLQNFNKNDETFLVNRYIINDYSYMLENKKLHTPNFKKGSKQLRQIVLFGSTTSEQEILDMEFPLVNYNDNWICMDMRRFYTKGQLPTEVTLKQSPDYTTVHLRNILTGLWAVGYHSDMYLYTLPHKAFAKWLSSIIAGKLGTPNDEITIEIMAFILYSRLFSDKNTRDVSRELDMLSTRYREHYFTTGLLDSVYDKTLDMETIEDFCNLIYEVTGNIRFKGFNYVVLVNFIKNNWIGGNYRNYLSLALEFPPVWITFCYMALSNNNYKKTIIGDRVESVSKRGLGLEFVKSIDTFIRTEYGEF